MQPHVHAFVVTAAETFKFHGPVYEFSYCPAAGGPDGGWPSQWSLDPPGSSSLAQDADLDRLENLDRLPFPDAAARTVLCVDALEHAFEPRQAMDELIRVLAPGGMLLVVSTVEPSGPKHAERYWEPSPGAIERLMRPLSATLLGWQGTERSPHTLFGVGFKAPVSERFLGNVNRFLERFQTTVAAAGGVGWWPRLRRLAALLRASRDERRRIRDHDKAQFVVHMPITAQSRQRLLADCLPDQPTGGRIDLKQ
jgi:SAM-dependent methyltransferase